MKRLFRSMTGATALVFSCSLALACAGTNGAGSETHVVCSRDVECANVGSRCVAGKCVSNDPGTGGRSAGGGAGEEAAGGRSAGGQFAGGQSAGGQDTGGAGTGGSAANDAGPAPGHPDGGNSPPSCVDLPVDAGAHPGFCPLASEPRPEPGSLPPPKYDKTSVTLKFVEGSHVRMTSGKLGIDSRVMLDEDPGLLRCAGLTVEAAECCVAGIEAALSPELGISVTRIFTRPEADLDAERASGRKMSGEYLNDLNLYYLVVTTEDRLPAVYDLLARSRCVDTVYYNSFPEPA